MQIIYIKNQSGTLEIATKDCGKESVEKCYGKKLPWTGEAWEDSSCCSRMPSNEQNLEKAINGLQKEGYKIKDLVSVAGAPAIKMIKPGNPDTTKEITKVDKNITPENPESETPEKPKSETPEKPITGENSEPKKKDKKEKKKK